MDSEKLVNEIFNSQFVLDNIPADMQPGIPCLKNKGSSLYITLYPHRETVSDGKLNIWEKRYVMKLLYPSKRIVRFSDLSLEEGCRKAQAAASFDIEMLRNRDIFLFRRGFSVCTEVLDFYDRHGFVTDVVMKEYNRDFGRIIGKLGLQGLYEVAE